MDNQPVETESYIDFARTGRGSWRTYTLGVVLIVAFFWLGIGGVATAALILLFATLGMNIDDLTGLFMNTENPNIDKNAAFLIANIAFPIFLLGILLVVRFLHNRPYRSVVTGAPRVRWDRVGKAFGLWFLLGGAMSLLEYSLWSGTFSFSFEPARFVPFLLLALTLTPIQTSAEELFFRGYLLQAASLATRNKAALSVISGVVFALPHFANPEVSAGFWLAMAYYFAFGVFLAWISLKDGGLEAALGIHAANNLYGGVVVNFQGSALPTYAVFFTSHFDPVYNLFSGFAVIGIFYALMYLPKNGFKPG